MLALQIGKKEKALKALGELPPFSPVLNKVMASLNAQDVSFSALGDLIEKDAVLAGNVLRMVNSALYARRGTVNSVRFAISLLGLNKLRNAVLGISITRMWHQLRSPTSWSMARFNLHSAAVAVLTDQIAQHASVHYAEGAFAAGLLHDLGSLLIALSLPEEYGRILQLHDTRGGALFECERQVLGFDHAELSAAALESWNLPAAIQAGVKWHHAPDSDPERYSKDEISMSRALSAADACAHSMGIAQLPSRNSVNDADTTPLENLGMNRDEALALFTEFQPEYDAITQFFR